jgi:hypothetical protein
VFELDEVLPLSFTSNELLLSVALPLSETLVLVVLDDVFDNELDEVLPLSFAELPLSETLVLLVLDDEFDVVLPLSLTDVDVSLEVSLVFAEELPLSEIPRVLPLFVAVLLVALVLLVLVVLDVSVVLPLSLATTVVSEPPNAYAGAVASINPKAARANFFIVISSFVVWF